MPVHLSLENRVALITGGSRGIGAATVRAFVEAGARVVFTYEKAREQAASLCRELGSERCVALACPTLEREKEFSTPSQLGRVGTPEEIAAPILFLCTPHASFITGEVFNVNGGAMLVG
jgi:NAD(P)-dependent dehydrogenase (short-subunit alcohol dehydrogenase family)